jgi:hypothetical protein
VFPVVTAELIKAADFNTTISDIAAALTNCVTKDNQSTTPALTVGTLTATTAANLPANATVGGQPALTRRYTTGEVILSISSTAPTGTVAMNGTTIGSAISGATGRANSDTQALFELIWTSSDNTLSPIQDASGAPTTRGASAAADFAANKRMPVPAPQDGDALLMAISSSVISRSAGEVLSHTHTATAANSGIHNHGVPSGSSEGDDPNTCTNGGGRNGTVSSDAAGEHSHTITVDAFGGTKNKAAGLFLKPYIAL